MILVLVNDNKPSHSSLSHSSLPSHSFMTTGMRQTVCPTSDTRENVFTFPQFRDTLHLKDGRSLDVVRWQLHRYVHTCAIL